MKFTFEGHHMIGKLDHGDLAISGDKREGFCPYELFVSSLVGCSGILLNKILNKKRLPFKKIELEAVVDNNEEKANQIKKVAIIAYIRTNQSISVEQAEKISRLVVKNCGMIQSVNNSIETSFLIKILE
ncbi:OsmC family protein [Calidifontibacillus erzurumensis]|uniref:OsmC family protein n=1 Tax=Calidifontibacillus erzurumensis TaxID=2741433 RepID=UPI0035B51003